MEKFIENKNTEIEQKIFSSRYPLSIEDFAALAWEWMVNKYPSETADINLLEAVEALSYKVIDLIGKDKLYLYDWISGHDGGMIARYKIAT